MPSSEDTARRLQKKESMAAAPSRSRFFMAIQRRRLLFGAGAYLFSSAMRLRAEHHIISANPLIASVELNQETGRYVSLDDFFVRDHYAVPAAVEISLRVEGEVDRPRVFTQNELGQLKRVELGAVLECAGSLVGPLCQTCNGLWRGWRLKELLALVKPKVSGRFVNLYGKDGYYRSIPIERAIRDGILATHLNGKILRPNHGASLRVVFSGWYGMDSVKWLDRIVIAEEPAAAKDSYQYMEATRSPSGKLELQPLPQIQPKSVMLTPQAGAVVPNGILQMEGLAWSGTGKIAKVEVGVNGGTWRAAEVSREAGFEWVRWHCKLPVSERGPLELACRATDENGLTQPEFRDPKRADPYANNWYHRIKCVAL